MGEVRQALPAALGAQWTGAEAEALQGRQGAEVRGQMPQVPSFSQGQRQGCQALQAGPLANRGCSRDCDTCRGVTPACKGLAKLQLLQRCQGRPIGGGRQRHKVALLTLGFQVREPCQS